MKNHFLSRFDADNLRKTGIYFIIAVSLIAISLIVGISDNFLTIAMLLSGIVLFLYAVLHPWEKAIYYFILLVISVILLILLFKVGIGILVKIESKLQIPNRWAESMAWNIGGVCFAGFIAGIIGALRFRKYE